jgi:hypothetical protein
MDIQTNLGRYLMILMLLASLSLFGCTAKAADNSTASLEYSRQAVNSSNVPANQCSMLTDQCDTATNSSGQSGSAGINLTFIKFHGNAQCVSCTNLGKFANATLVKNFPTEMQEGKIRYLDINAQTDTTNPYVLKYKPDHASLYLLVEGAGKNSYEELIEAWYYTNDQARYEQYIMKIIKEKLG